MGKCKGVYNGGIYRCDVCGRVWDYDDEPPEKCEPLPSTPVTTERQPDPVKSKPVTDKDWANLREAMETGDFSNFE